MNQHKTNKSALKRKIKIQQNEDSILVQSAISASTNAVRISKALGLSISIIKNNQVITIKPDNSIEVVKILPKIELDTKRLKKGMILNRK